jgi:hypothetical protein
MKYYSLLVASNVYAGQVRSRDMSYFAQYCAGKQTTLLMHQRSLSHDGIPA